MTEVIEPEVRLAPHPVERSLKHGAVWVLGSQIAQQTIRFVSVLILARLLAPDDYGAAALAVTLASYSTTVGDLGFGTALVQAPTASQRLISTAWWAALAAGVIGSAIVALGAYPAARALNEPEVASLIIVGGSTLLLYALGSTSSALLTRSMNFGVLQGAALFAWAVASVCAIALALAGAGPWSLVAQQLAYIGLTSLCVVLAARWRPTLDFSRAGLKSLSRFALPFTGASVFFLLQGLVAALFIGRLLGIDQLGIWTFSMAMVVIPISLIVAPLTRVLYAAFARMRDDPKRMAEVWLNATGLLAAIVLPMSFGLIAVAPDIIPVTFGRQWTAAVPVVQILCVFVAARALQAWNASVIDAAGKPHFSMFSMAAVLLVLPLSIWVGSSFSIEGVAFFYVLSILLFAELPSFLFTSRELGLRPREVVARLGGVFVCSVLLCCVVALVRVALERGGVGVGVRLSLSIAAGIVFYGVSLRFFAPSIFRQLLRMARRRGRSSEPLDAPAGGSES